MISEAFSKFVCICVRVVPHTHFDANINKHDFHVNLSCGLRSRGPEFEVCGVLLQRIHSLVAFYRSVVVIYFGSVMLTETLDLIELKRTARVQPCLTLFHT